MRHAPRNYVGVTLHFLAPDKSSPTSSIESGRTPPIRTQIIGVVILIESFADVSEDSNLITIDLPLLKTCIQQQHPLRAVIIAFKNYGLLRSLAARDPTVLEQVEGKVHVFVCQHHKKHLIPEGPSAADLTQDWFHINESMKATGACCKILSKWEFRIPNKQQESDGQIGETRFSTFCTHLYHLLLPYLSLNPAHHRTWIVFHVSSH